MDITKRFDRILQIFFLLQSKTAVTVREMEERFAISRRTIYRDLKALETAGVPTAYDPGKGYSIAEGFRIQPSRFTQEEVLSLMIAEKIMQQHETQFVKRHFEAALMKVKSSFQLQHKDAVLKWQDKLKISGGLNTGDYLPDVIEILLQSTVSKRIAHLSYVKSSDTRPMIRKVEPVGLFYESNFWYLLAFCHLRKDYRNFRLDRIKNVLVSEEPYSRDHLAAEEIRKNATSSVKTKIKITADRQYAHYLFWERQSFGYQSEEITDQQVMMYFECDAHPTAFLRWFMKFIDVAEIIEPSFLKEELRVIVVSAMSKIQA